MRNLWRNRSRGVIGVLGMAGLTFVLVMLTGTVLLRSLDAYKASSDLENRLQARAAAEGAVVALVAAQGKPPQQPLEIGRARVRFDSKDTATSTGAVRFTVEVYRSPSRAALVLPYQVDLETSGSAGLVAQGLEVAR